MTTSSVPGAVPDPGAADSAAQDAVRFVFDVGRLGQVAPGIDVPPGIPTAAPGTSELAPSHPPLTGKDPRGVPSTSFAIAHGSVPGGTGAPGFYFLPLPSAGSPVVPGEGDAGGGTMPGPSTAQLPSEPAMPGASAPDVPATPTSPEDDAALRVAADLMQHLSVSEPVPTEALLRQADRPGAAPHLPTSDAGIRDLLADGMAPAVPDAPPAPGVDLATEVAAPPDLYFLPTEPAVPVDVPASSSAFDVHAVRRDFPILDQKVNGKDLVWFDNAATTQKPQAVIDAVSRFYQRDNSNIHRAAHTLAARSTDAYENARDTVRRFLGASSPEEIVFARGTTEAINLVAKSWGRKHIREGDEIILTQLEHHANIVPWQMLAQETGAVIRVVPITDAGEIMLEEYGRMLGPRTRIVSVVHVSNALGTVVPVEEMIEAAHRHGVPVLVDGAQSVAHMPADVQEMGADFYVFSGHKIFAPMGVGALYARRELLEDMPPWQGGGSMIRHVTFERTIYEDPPAKFEAGTPTVADAVGLGAALEYLERLGIGQVAAYEEELLQYATARMLEVDGLRLIGTAPNKVSVLSFLLDGTKTEEVARYLDSEGIAVRAGHHCAQPTMQRYGVTGTVRPSLALYNTRGEVDRMVEALKRYRHR